MQLLDLPLAIGFGVPADAGIEGARRVLQQLLLPGIDLVGMDLVALGKVGHRRLFPNRFQRDLRLQGAVNLASRLHHGLLRLPNGAADFQLSPWSPKQGPFQFDPETSPQTTGTSTMSGSGVFYLPNATFKFQGTSTGQVSTCTEVIAATITLAGT